MNISLKKALQWRALLLKDILRGQGRQKVFCVGMNKTGTKSIAAALRELGLVVAPSSSAAILLDDWTRRDFRRIKRRCQLFQAFQDSPFSYPYTYQAMDAAFPKSKFILTERTSPAQWYNSVTSFAKKFFKTKGVPTKEELQRATYCYQGFAWQSNRARYDTPENDPYQRDQLIDSYAQHNRAVKEYFRHRAQDLLVLNVSDDGAMEALCQFLGVPYSGQPFPWKNETAKLVY